MKTPITEMKLRHLQVKLALAISLASLGFTPLLAQPIKPIILVQRSTFNSSGQLNKPLIFNAPAPPDDINAPGSRIGGGKRGCKDIDKQLTGSKEKLLTALAPVYGPSDSELVLGLTTASHPTFWFYVPYSGTLSAEFVLQDEADQTIYQTPVSLSGTPGVISLSISSTAAPLEIGKRYHWYFNIYCQAQQPPVFVDGWVKRDSLNPILKSQLAKATQRQRVALYAARGFWYEALTASAELRRTDPKSTDWAAMLQEVGLNDIALEPMVECCQSAKRGEGEVGR